MLEPCGTCAVPLVPATDGDGPRTATHGTVAGTLDGPAVWRCPDGHERRSADLAAATAETFDALTVARRTRLGRTLRCGVCDAPFPMPGRRATRSVTLTGTGLPATRLTLDLPVLRCAEDAAENLPPECTDDLRQVLAALLAAGPPGGDA